MTTDCLGTALARRTSVTSSPRVASAPPEHSLTRPFSRSTTSGISRVRASSFYARRTSLTTSEKSRSSSPVRRLTIRSTPNLGDGRSTCSLKTRSHIICSSSPALSTGSPCAGTKTTLMSVSRPAINPSRLSPVGVHLNNGLVGWAKEESLRGIVNWFDFWLAGK